MTTSDKTATLYDIILDPAAYPGAPNPWKARYTLNYLSIPYRTQWIPLRSVGTIRASLSLPANRAHPTGAAFPTLPVLQDGDSLIGDSFDIALHLHLHACHHPHHHNPSTFPSSSPPKILFHPHTIPLLRIFNAHVDNLFSAHGAPLAGSNMPFDPLTAEADKASILDRIGMGHKKWEDLIVPPGPVRDGMLRAFETALDAKLAGCFGVPGKVVGGLATEGFGEWRGAGVVAGEGEQEEGEQEEGEQEEGEEEEGEGQKGRGVGKEKGPFMDGARRPVYADFVVGGWLQFMRQGLPEWEDLRDKWSGGKWGRLFDALKEWEKVDGREGVMPTRQ